MIETTTSEPNKSSVSGKLKIFLGYAAGVGKTYAMLEAAHRASDTGIDVVVGYVDSTFQGETVALLDGLEQLPLKENQEFDLDAALQRSPQLLILDELAHRNDIDCRHLKRYQDVEELLRAGIDVYSTVNIQQLESLTDMVAAITGETVPERIPDSVFDSAYQVELVDLEPADLLDRLMEGKISGRGQRLTETKLAALRELALRRTADRLDRLPDRVKEVTKSKTGEHIMICLSGAPSNAKVIRTAARMADAFHGTFTALFVETPSFQKQSEQDRIRFQTNLRLAEELGARITTVYGDDPAIQIAEYARISGVTKIVLGRSPQRRTPFSSKTLMDRLNEYAPDLDLYIIPDHSNAALHTTPVSIRMPRKRTALNDTLRMLGILAVCSAAGFVFLELGFSQATISMVYILGVLIAAISTTGPVYSLIASVISVFCFNYFFAYPYFSFLSTPDHLATCGIMLIVGILGSTITTRVKDRATQSANKAYRTEILLETSQKLQQAEDTQTILEVTATQLTRLLERSLVLYPVDQEGTLMRARLFRNPKSEENISSALIEAELEIAQWVLANNKQAGMTTLTFPDARCLYMAVRGSERVEAVAGIFIDPSKKPDAFERNLLIATLDQCGIALEKERLARAKQAAEEAVRQEALRANLLRAISHDLRTPLTSISGNAGILMENGSVLDETKKKAIYSSIYDDSLWLISLVENLLSITRMENGTMKLNIQPELMEEVFDEALTHLDRNASKHNIRVELPDELLMADMDARLIVQVIINLVNNAIKYTQDGSNITLSARAFAGMVLVKVADDGPGISDHAKTKVFDMFYTENNQRGDGRRGLGLGLALCKSIVNAHGGIIAVTDNEPDGSCFSFTLKPSEVTALE